MALNHLVNWFLHSRARKSIYSFVSSSSSSLATQQWDLWLLLLLRLYSWCPSQLKIASSSHKIQVIKNWSRCRHQQWNEERWRKRGRVRCAMLNWESSRHTQTPSSPYISVDDVSFGFSLQFCFEKDESLINFNNNQWQSSSKKKGQPLSSLTLPCMHCILPHCSWRGVVMAILSRNLLCLSRIKCHGSCSDLCPSIQITCSARYVHILSILKTLC